MRSNNSENRPQTQYLDQLLSDESEFMKLSRSYAEQLGLGGICLSPYEGGIISTLIRLHGCLKFVEVGTLTGLSGQYILKALPSEGTLWTFEKSEKHAEKAADVFKKLKAKQLNLPGIEFKIGDAQEHLIDIEDFGPFDGIFIDANKSSYGYYLDWAERNIRSGGLIMADNVFLFNGVWAGPEGAKIKISPKQVALMQEFNRRLANKDKFYSTIIPTEEGLFIAIKK